MDGGQNYIPCRSPGLSMKRRPQAAARAARVLGSTRDRPPGNPTAGPAGGRHGAA